jgi:hypothetical protein
MSGRQMEIMCRKSGFIKFEPKTKYLGLPFPYRPKKELFSEVVERLN